MKKHWSISDEGMIMLKLILTVDEVEKNWRKSEENMKLIGVQMRGATDCQKLKKYNFC